MTSMRADPPDAEPGASVSRDLPIAEVAQRTGLSKDTLRYYEKAGLVQALGRSSGGQRRYAARDLDWLAFLLRLRATAMSIADMRRFADLRRAGNVSVPDRIELLTTHRDEVEQHIATLQGHLDALKAKIDHYQGLLAPQPETDQP
jgi:DNA-binding transcriptional MerR regulator